MQKKAPSFTTGHQPGFVLTTLKRMKIRGVESFSMVCSEKELGISEEHEGVIIFDDDAPTGMPLVDYIGDVVISVSTLPNMTRCASMIGLAREVAAFLNKPLRMPDLTLPAGVGKASEQVKIEIRNPELNPRFVAGLIRGVKARPQPVCDPTAPEIIRHAPHQLGGGRHQLRYVGSWPTFTRL